MSKKLIYHTVLGPYVGFDERWGLWLAHWPDGRPGVAFGITVAHAAVALVQGTTKANLCECGTLRPRPSAN